MRYMLGIEVYGLSWASRSDEVCNRVAMFAVYEYQLRISEERIEFTILASRRPIVTSYGESGSVWSTVRYFDFPYPDRAIFGS